MARSRNIKPAFFRNEHVVGLPFEDRLLFIGLWTLADKEGRLEDRPFKIKMEVFPADDVDISLGLSRLDEAGLVKRYEVDELKCVQILKFKKHQNPHHREADSELPAIPEGQAQATENKEAVKSPGFPGASPSDSLLLIPDSPILNPDSLSKGSASCDASPADSEKPVVVRDFPTKDGKTFTASEKFIGEMKATYPRIDVEYQLKKARLWLIANDARQKTPRGMNRFLNNWMGNQKPTAEIHPIQSRHTGFEDRDYSAGLIEGVADDAANF